MPKSRLPRPNPTNSVKTLNPIACSGALAAKRSNNAAEQRLRHVISERKDYRDERNDQRPTPYGMR